MIVSLAEERLADAVVRAENVGGIRETEVTFSPGVTILVGSNATNRTSFLQAVMAALGSDDVTIKGDADEASVELTLGEDTYTRELRRRSGDVVTDGDPYLDDPTLADLFAFLLESNEARRAVTTGADLRELIMRPVDTAAIQAEIDDLIGRRESLERDLEEIDARKGDLPGLEAERTRLQEEIEETKAELEAKEAELEAADADLDETREEKAELEDTLDELRSKRADLDDVRYDLETERESLDALEQERRALQDEEGGLPETPMGEVEELDDAIGRLRERKQTFEREITELQSAIGFNEEMLEDVGSSAFDPLSEEPAGAVTDELVDDTVTCWTCGSEVDEAQIETTVDRLRELSATKVAEVSELEEEIDELTAERRDLQQAQRERERTERRLAELADEIEQTEATVEDLQDRRETLTEEIESVEAEVEALEDDAYGAVLDLHKEANQLEYELGRLETELERVEEEIAEVERRIDDESDVESELETVTAEIADLRSRIERIEAGAVEQFNDHMDDVLEMLDYRNIDRIWLERVERDVREGRRTVSKSAFELHVVRTTESGAAYEDTVDHLSESEREVTGLVFALAGYLAHDVHETVPFMLLDSLEAIDADRIAALVDHLREYTGYLLVTLLPEDASRLSEEYDRVTEI